MGQWSSRRESSDDPQTVNIMSFTPALAQSETLGGGNGTRMERMASFQSSVEEETEHEGDEKEDLLVGVVGGGNHPLQFSGNCVDKLVGGVEMGRDSGHVGVLGGLEEKWKAGTGEREESTTSTATLTAAAKVGGMRGYGSMLATSMGVVGETGRNEEGGKARGRQSLGHTHVRGLSSSGRLQSVSSGGGGAWAGARVSGGRRLGGRGGGRHKNSGVSVQAKDSRRIYDEEEGGVEDKQSPEGEPPKVIFRERWRQKEARLRRESEFGQLVGWRLLPIIVKSGDDLRQEQLASQFIGLADSILRGGPPGLRSWLRPYDIVATSPDSGIIEAVPDTVSLDALKKNDPCYTTLLDFFQRHFGSRGSDRFEQARSCFVESLAAYCIVTYILQVKDRHNGNILLDALGHVIHIDFGFMLANSPGGNFNFESAPFKLTAEFVELMDGPCSSCFKGFRDVCVQTFMTLRRQMHRLVLLVETSSVGNSHLPCFGGRPEGVVEDLRGRFCPELHDRAAIAHVHTLVEQSMHSWRTRWYDRYQSFMVGIAM
ncbi:unnamed protein product [Choristocarpus tenellus]